MINPKHARDFARALGVLAKTDELLDGQELREKAARLRQVLGVGAALAQTLLSEVSELDELNRKEIAALVGVAPIILPPKTSSHQEDVGGKCDIEVGESGRTGPL